jgi:hypothetical protein
MDMSVLDFQAACVLLPTPRWLWSWLKVTKFMDVMFVFVVE